MVEWSRETGWAAPLIKECEWCVAEWAATELTVLQTARSHWTHRRVCSITRSACTSLGTPSATFGLTPARSFEGMKAYRGEDGTIRLFRPDMNMARMNRSAARIALPEFDPEALIELIKKLVMLDAKWIPSEPGYSLYLRKLEQGCPTSDDELTICQVPP